MSKPIEIDLRRDLPKVREQLEAILPYKGRCLYAAPCAVGAMIPEAERARLDKTKDANGIYRLKIEQLVKLGVVAMPVEQIADAQSLQSAFDLTGPGEPFERTLARLEAKYLTGEVG